MNNIKKAYTIIKFILEYRVQIMKVQSFHRGLANPQTRVYRNCLFYNCKIKANKMTNCICINTTVYITGKNGRVYDSIFLQA